MAIVLPVPLTVQQIRVLQEFRRIGTDSLPLDAIQAIKHPAGGGVAPVDALASRGYLVFDPSASTMNLTDRGRDFLAIEVKPAAEGDRAPE